MKLPPDSFIDPRKITDYLLLRRDMDDKSGFLRLAGYERQHASRLLEDIRAMLAEDAEAVEISEYAEKFAIDGTLTGPNGRQLRVRSIWAKLLTTGEVRFVTLYPPRT
jgi:hypothetical protein